MIEGGYSWREVCSGYEGFVHAELVGIRGKSGTIHSSLVRELLFPIEATSTRTESLSFGIHSFSRDASS